MRDTRVATVIVASDGSGDVTDIQAGIDRLPTIGGVVYLKDGTYTITTTIEITNDDISIIGAGNSTRIITTGQVTVFDVNGRNRITIENLYLYGGGATGIERGIFFSNSTQNSIVKNCWIENFGVGIELDTVNNCVFSQNIIISNLWGIYLDTCTYNKINKSGVLSNIQTGIYLINASSNNLIIENVVKDNDVDDTTTYDGISLSTNCDYNTIASNRCENNDRYEINVINNTCDKNLVHGNICIGADHVGAINDAGTGTVDADNIIA